jgi:hypothetical protein
MKFQRFVIGLCLLLVFLALSFSVSAQDETPEVTPTAEIVVDATEEATEALAEPTQDVTVIVVEQPSTDEPTTVVNNNGFSFLEFLVGVMAFVLSIFAGAKMIVVPILKDNRELANKLGEYISPDQFDKAIGTTSAGEQLAKTLTPNFTADDEGLRRIRQDLEEFKALLHPLLAKANEIKVAGEAAAADALYNAVTPPVTE